MAAPHGTSPPPTARPPSTIPPSPSTPSSAVVAPNHSGAVPPTSPDRSRLRPPNAAPTIPPSPSTPSSVVVAPNHSGAVPPTSPDRGRLRPPTTPPFQIASFLLRPPHKLNPSTKQVRLLYVLHQKQQSVGTSSPASTSAS
ncbi:hypothetical protein D1007_38220 [Hordeum vulgare]|nr:hypothetical protein D1007_38220 [Hordeum vulgare]